LIQGLEPMCTGRLRETRQDGRLSKCFAVRQLAAQALRKTMPELM